MPLHVEQRFSHGRHGRHFARALAHARLSYRGGHVLPTQPDGEAAGLLISEFDRVLFDQLSRELAQRRRVLPADCRALRSQRNRPIQRARIDQQVAEIVGDSFGDGRLARARRPIDGNDWSAFQRCTSMSAPSARSVPAKRGKLTAKQSTSSMMVSASATKPSTAAVMAKR